MSHLLKYKAAVEKPFFKEMVGSEPIQDYRGTYRQFRITARASLVEKGAGRTVHLKRPAQLVLENSHHEGGAPSLVHTISHDSSAQNLPDLVFKAEDEEKVKAEKRARDYADVFESETVTHIAQIMEDVLAYRAAYRAFRMGEAKGAHGELSEVAQRMTREHIRVLPIAQEKQVQVRRQSSFVWKGRRQEFEKKQRQRAEQEQKLAEELAGLDLEGAEEDFTLTGLDEAEKEAAGIPVGISIKTEGWNPTDLHVHFGAGKLGMGLLLPALQAARSPFCIIEPGFPMWNDLMAPLPVQEEGRKYRVLTMAVNGEALSRLIVVPPGGAVPSSFIEAMLKRKRPARKLEEGSIVYDGVFILYPPGGEDGEGGTALRQAVAYATSFSTSVGPAMPAVAGLLIKLKKQQREKEGPSEAGSLPPALPTLYGCENDHNGVEKMKEQLGGVIDVVDVMVDRICSNRTVEPAEGVDFRHEVTAEPYTGAIVVLTPRVEDFVPSYLPGLGGENLLLPPVDTAAQYLANRKIMIVNGMHTTLAFSTLCSKIPPHPEGGGLATPVEDLPLLSPMEAQSPWKEDLWAWAAARCLMVIAAHPPEVIKTAHGFSDDGEVVQELLRFARTTLERFSSVKDTTGRVLSGGVTTRWQGRLNTCLDFLSKMPIGVIPLGKRILRAAGVNEGHMRRAVRRLVDDSKRFTDFANKKIPLSHPAEALPPATPGIHKESSPVHKAAAHLAAASILRARAGSRAKTSVGAGG
uniref:Uncharacterized protein n=1 Tax=Chromera velia CCMP2878 TaxID=1169474 RepID=A0A0G4FWD4_9ALVE|mmetsp:Transcript_33094/g.65665  ORF Transcript_33094/g.65665 Transcript_33094/m.65665 type:complete len:748 (-) Transcript_33094:1754-3997(-)|eukprot:Cvel_19105.t1-p1 / transcript=Cvel_19105.t1 / gene=Cvel_19105 / organism=Chromera_velia_CCMP2878 / gene_product=hypothetical protein / transcript_product=hypothetical protein / location=Cvel_scaffold1622:7173-14644(+) / protein_length=747 / sequence_SO=supercontig / SO=protein_coding / is_pseudo=false